MFRSLFGGLGLVLVLGGIAQAGTIEVSPSVQTGIGIQNAQQIQLGYGVRQQSGTLTQQQPQYQYISPNSGGYRYNYPGQTDIRVNPNVQTGIGVQNAQQIQLGLPEFQH
jgi:hypothetical protein